MNQQKLLKKTIQKNKESTILPRKARILKAKVLIGYETKIKDPFKFSSKIKNKTRHLTDTNEYGDNQMDIQKSEVHQPSEYLQIQEIPIYQPSTQEFREPLLLIKKLCELGYTKYGAVKIKPPETWKPTFQFNYVEKRISTRKQVIQDLCKGKCFEQNPDAYTIKEFECLATKFEIEHGQKTNIAIKDPFRSNEFEFWAMVDDPTYTKKPIVVEYAADLPSKKYGSAFAIAPSLNFKSDKIDDDRLHNFNLNNINRADNSLFKIINEKNTNISGITLPWVYLGMLFASFCWHIEDNFMYSVNYMHKGAPKTWYVIPGDYKSQFEQVIRSKYPAIFAKTPNILYSIILMLNPLELIKNNIPVYRTEQSQNEYVITFPKAYHAGFSHGFNVAEAVNIAPIEWLNAGRESIDDYAYNGFMKKASFPHEWLVMENIRYLDQCKFTEENKQMLLEHYKQIKTKELQSRENITKCYNKLKIQKFPNDNIKYDTHICTSCKNYTYLSYLECTNCKHKACTSHVTVCNCLNPAITLHNRFTDQELNEFSLEH